MIRDSTLVQRSQLSTRRDEPDISLITSRKVVEVEEKRMVVAEETDMRKPRGGINSDTSNGRFNVSAGPIFKLTFDARQIFETQ